MQEVMLADEGWRSFTAVEVPEFEGYSSGRSLNCGAVAEVRPRVFAWLGN